MHELCRLEVAVFWVATLGVEHRFVA